MTTNTNWTLQYHHLLRNPEWSELADDLDILFGGNPDSNPLNRNLESMKVMLPSNTTFAASLQTTDADFVALNSISVGQTS